MKQQQNQPQTPQDGNDSRRNLAALYAATVLDYFCTPEAPEQMREGAEMMGETLHELGRLAAGTIPALMRVTAHYAATAADADKSAILATLTAPNGAAAILARLTSEADRLNVWGDVLETLADG